MAWFVAWSIAGASAWLCWSDVCKAVREYKEAGRRWDRDTRRATARAVVEFAISLLALLLVALDDADSAERDKRIAAAEKKTAVLQSDLDGERKGREEDRAKLAAAERRLAPRRLTKDVKNELSRRFRTIPAPREITVLAMLGDPESTAFAEDFIAAFRQAGWSVKYELYNFPGQLRGYAFAWNAKLPEPPNGTAILDAVRASMPLSVIKPTDAELSQPFTLCVFSKPTEALPSGKSYGGPAE